MTPSLSKSITVTKCINKQHVSKSLSLWSWWKDQTSQMTEQLDGIFENFIWGQESNSKKKCPKHQSRKTHSNHEASHRHPWKLCNCSSIPSQTSLFRPSVKPLRHGKGKVSERNLLPSDLVIEADSYPSPVPPKVTSLTHTIHVCKKSSDKTGSCFQGLIGNIINDPGIHLHHPGTTLHLKYVISH